MYLSAYGIRDDAVVKAINHLVPSNYSSDRTLDSYSLLLWRSVALPLRVNPKSYDKFEMNRRIKSLCTAYANSK